MEYEFYGRHLLIQLYGVDSEILNNVEFIEKAIVEICNKATFSLLSVNSHKFDPMGVTSVGILSESHISFHTYPDKNAIFCDIFTCGDTDPENGLDILLKIFKPKYYVVKLVERQ